MIYYSIFYILINGLFGLSKVIKSNFFIFLSIFIAFLFSALRYNAGYDFFNYYHLVAFEEGASFERLEIFNRYLILMSRWMDFPQFYFIATSGIYVFFMTKGLI